MLGAARPRSRTAEPVVLRGALGAQSEQLDPMRVDHVARPALDLARHRLDPAIFDLGASTTALADDVMVVCRLADDVGVLSGRKVEALDEAELLEQLQGAEDGRPTDAKPTPFCLADEIERGEMIPALRDHLGNEPARLRHVVAGFVQGIRKGKWITHRRE